MSNARSLPAELNIYALAGLRQEWVQRLPKRGSAARGSKRGPSPWPVDASQVAEVDAAGLQLLVSLSHALHARHRQLVLQQPSDALARGCERLGLGAWLAAASEPGVHA
jgi:ABC-type transporter Mla MlaB component